MPRQGRINVEGGIYHVIQRGIERREIFRDDKDREKFLRRFADGLKEAGCNDNEYMVLKEKLIRAGYKKTRFESMRIA